MKIWSLPKHENLTTGKKILWKRREIAPPLSHNIFYISLTSRVQLHIYLLNLVVRIIFSSILQIWYVEVRIYRSISESPLEFKITRVDCTLLISQRKHILWVPFRSTSPRGTSNALLMSIHNKCFLREISKLSDFKASTSWLDKWIFTIYLSMDK